MRPRFSLNRRQKCGLEWPKCPLSPQIWESVYFAPMLATWFYCDPLPTTFDHIIGCFPRMSRGNVLLSKNSSESKAKRIFTIYAATRCGFYVSLQQSLGVEFLRCWSGSLDRRASLQLRCLARARTRNSFRNGTRQFLDSLQSNSMLCFLSWRAF
jgi:hypothetical protein